METRTVYCLISVSAENRMFDLVLLVVHIKPVGKVAEEILREDTCNLLTYLKDGGLCSALLVGKNSYSRLGFAVDVSSTTFVSFWIESKASLIV